MKLLYTCLFLVTLSMLSRAQSFCNASGNVIIYSNYDGGFLQINVDQNIPNLKIGIVSYEAIDVQVTGTYSANVVQVVYAGYNSSPSTHCSPGVPTTTLHVAPTTSTSIIFAPTVTYSNSYGYTSVICNYSCSNTTSQGGCNTPDQITDYFMAMFGGTFYYHKTQYGCYLSTSPQNVSAGGNCCIQPPVTTGIQKNNLVNNNTVSPNPATNQLDIKFSNPSAEHTITLLNQLGQTISTMKSSQSNEKINVKDLERGMYFVLIEEGSQSQYQKIILE
ncbi:MAG: T9SS type A sorting domain-containing protein [Bacteroidetes bacterium]|nr:T9SS type A sorting domain-containing protein [Bacteroidota bacterium]